MKFAVGFTVLFLVLCCGTAAPPPPPASSTVGLYDVFEAQVTNTRTYSNPFDFNVIELRTLFTSPTGKQISFFGFYDGDGAGGQTGNIWKMRFMPDEIGTWTYSYTWTDGTPGGSGSFTVTDTGLHGPLKVASDNPWYFMNARNQPFHARPYGMHHFLARSATGRMSSELANFKNALQTRVADRGYNLVMWPDMGDRDRLGASSSGIGKSDSWWLNASDPFRFSIAAFRANEDALAFARQRGIYAFTFAGMINQGANYSLADFRVFLRYFIARMAPQANYFGWSPTWEWMDIWSPSQVSQIMQEAYNLDPWKRPLSTHDNSYSTFTGWLAFSLRQAPARNVFMGNSRRAGVQQISDASGSGGIGDPFINRPIIGSEDIWESPIADTFPGWDVPRNGVEAMRGAWGIQMAGIMPLYDEWNVWGPAGSNGQGEPYVRRMFDFFFSKTKYRQYQQLNNLVSSSAGQIASGIPGQEYLVYGQSGGSITINLTAASNSTAFSVLWYNPATGAEQSGASVTGGASRTVASPFAGDSVLLLSGSSGSTDTIPPSVVTGLTATVVSSSQINLGWNASTDNVGVTGYFVEQCQGSGCTSFSQVGKPSGTSFSVTGMTAATLYRYRVRATDAAGNLAGYSSIVDATTLAGPPVPQRSSLISNMSAVSGLTYVASTGLTAGQTVYTDRVYSFTSVPAFLQAQEYIKTANDDKASTGSSFLSFDVSQNATIYVAHDDRISPKPAWLSSFTDTGQDLQTSIDRLSIYQKVFAAGRVTLGGNAGDAFSMYTVIVVPGSTPPPPDTTPPTVVVSAPAAGATVSGSSVVVSATASDNVGLAGIQLRVDGINIGAEDTTAPYSATWNTTTVSNGSHALTAVARDAAGNTATSGAVSVTVTNNPADTIAPTVSMTAPGEGASVLGSSVIVSVAASDNVGVAGVQFQLDGANLGAEDTVTPFSVMWNTTSISNGHHRLRAIARDAAGNRTTSAERDVSVNNDSTPSTVSIGNLASSMQPGTWAELNTVGFNNGAILESSGSSILQWSDKAVWNPLTKQLQFHGNPHYLPHKFVLYADSNNTWSTGPLAFTCTNCASHGFQHNSINPATGEHYYRVSGAKTIYRYSGGVWSPLPDVPSQSASISGAIEYFPERNGLLFVDGEWGVWFYSANQWTKLANTGAESGPGLPKLTMGPIDNFAVYNPVHKLVLFGGGDDSVSMGFRDIYKLTANGTITKLTNAPINLGISASIVTVDPVSGKYLIFGKNLSFYEYDVASDTWTLRTGSTPPIFQAPPATVFDVVATPVSTYGVVMFIKYYFDQSKVYIYKHASGPLPPTPAPPPPPPDTIPPVVSVTAPITGSSVSGTVMVSATASDTVGVAGVQFKLDGVNLGAEDVSSPYSVSWVATSTSNGSHTLTAVARDDAGNQTTSAPVTVTVNNSSPPTQPPPPSDFSARCQASGVVRCVGFDGASDIAGRWGDNSGITIGNVTAPAIDTSVRASGNGSLKFTIPPNAGSDSSGSYFLNFSNDLSVQFGPDSEFYVQWRQRFSPELINTAYAGGGGWKQAAITTGDQPAKLYPSCTSLGVTMNSYYHQRFPILYHSCTGSTSHGAYDGFYETWLNGPNGADFKLQNARPTPYCLYTQGYTTPPSYLPPTGNCFGYFPNEWMTFQVHIKTGPRIGDEFKNSYIEMWMAREGQPSQPVVNWGPYNLSAGNPTDNERYGKIWLLPYNTNKDPSVTYPTAYTWYDDLIISRNRIADPGGSVPLPPTDATAPTVSITTPSSGATVAGSAVTVSATASDDVGVIGVQLKLDGANLGPEKTSAPYSYSWNTTAVSNGSHVLAAVARDAAGHVTTSSTVTVTVNNGPAPPPSSNLISNVSVVSGQAAYLVSTGLATGQTVYIDRAYTFASVPAFLQGHEYIKTANDDKAYTSSSFLSFDISRNATVYVAHDDRINAKPSWLGSFSDTGQNLLTSIDTMSVYQKAFPAGRVTLGGNAGDGLSMYSVVVVPTSAPTPAPPPPDTTPPTVSITAPTGGATLSGLNVSVSAVASDNVGAVGVQFQLDGINLGAEDLTAPYGMVWNTMQATNGTHTLTAVARDAAGNRTISAAVAVRVSNAGDTTPPTVSITEPKAQKTVSSFVTVAATATDNTRVVGVQFAVNGVNLGEEDGTAPYAVVWDTTTKSDGNYAVTAIARDEAGNRSAPAVVSVSVKNGTGRRYPYRIAKRGGISWKVQGLLSGAAARDGDTAESPVTVGYVRVQTNEGTAAPAGTALIGFRSNGVLVSEAGVPTSASSVRGLIPAQVGGTVNTGVAMANANNQESLVSYFFRNAGGEVMDSGSFVLAPNQQIAAFLNEAPFQGPDVFQGTFEFNATTPVFTVALRRLTNERGEFLMTTLPIQTSAALAGGGLVLPHFADGGGWTTEVVLTNSNTVPLTGTVEFFSSGSLTTAGLPANVTVNGQTGSSFHYSLAPLGTVRLVTENRGASAQVGSVRVTSDGSRLPQGLAIFSFKQGGVTVSAAGIPLVASSLAFQTYIESSIAEQIRTGFAVGNPSSSPVTVNLELTTLEGTPTGLSKSVQIPANGQMAIFLDEIMPSVPDEFKGVLRLTGESPIAAVGLRGRVNERGNFIFTTVPVADDAGSGVPPVETIFPHIVNGGGYTTQLVLLGSGADGSASGSMLFFGKDGTPLTPQPN